MGTRSVVYPFGDSREAKGPCQTFHAQICGISFSMHSVLLLTPSRTPVEDGPLFPNGAVHGAQYIFVVRLSTKSVVARQLLMNPTLHH